MRCILHPRPMPAARLLPCLHFGKSRALRILQIGILNSGQVRVLFPDEKNHGDGQCVPHDI